MPFGRTLRVRQGTAILYILVSLYRLKNPLSTFPATFPVLEISGEKAYFLIMYMPGP